MIRPVLFQLHWFLGITAGTILAIMGITGASIAFEDEILRAFNAPLASVAAQHKAGQQALPLATLVEKVGGGSARSIERLSIDGSGQHASVMRIGGSDKRTLYFDPITGAVFGEPKGQAVFDFLENLHRRLALGDVGKTITGVCVAILLFFCLSGLYLRWPRRWLSPRAWLAIEWKRSGRSFLWSLHSVLGTWVLVVYLLIALTGMWWSWDWFRNGANSLLGGDVRPSAGASVDAGPRQAKGGVDFAVVQRGLESVEPGARSGWMDIRLGRGGRGGGPQAAGGQGAQGGQGGRGAAAGAGPGSTITVRFRAENAPHDRAFDTIDIDTKTGQVTRLERYDELPMGRKLLASIYALHVGSFFGMAGRIVNMTSAAFMSVFFVTGWMLYLDRRRKKRELRATRVTLAPASDDPWRVFFASQSGTAERLAWHAAGHLQASGVAVEVHPIARLDATMAAQTRRALFVVSTFGDGESPDSARLFERRMMSSRLSLSHLSYAMLGLGDRQYAAFCGFSRRVQAWMDNHGALSLAGPVELDRLDEEGLGRWHESLGLATGVVPIEPVVTDEPLHAWTLRDRYPLNPQSQSARMFMVSLAPPEGVTWRAGDILEVAIGHASHVASEPMREYSIASVASDGAAELVVRLVTHSEGVYGVGSGWLCRDAAVGEPVHARVRSNPGFHRMESTTPMILIGAGTGIAGLRSLLREAAEADCGGHWLIYGERTRQHDHAFGEEIAALHERGILSRVDTVFSRDQHERVYVQHKLAANVEALNDWLGRGATIYVCGSLIGMGEDVDATLRSLLGADVVDELAAAGRYRRDVY